MRKYLELFKNGFDSTINEKIKPLNRPYVGYSPGEGVVYTVIPEPADPNTYVTFTAEEDNSSIGLEKLSTNQTLEYSTDTTTWNTFNTETNIPLNNGDKVYVRGILSADNSNQSNYTQFKMCGKIAASGNCNSIWNYQDLDAPLKTLCGYYMFYGCTSLTTAPELPATTLASGCYESLFSYCTSLTTAPELPATTLTGRCYSNMFCGCTSLTTAPELPATTLAASCYSNMFVGTSLTTAPILPATTLAINCYNQMFQDCTSLTTIQILPATELARSCYSQMFLNCTSLTTAPELPATELASSCYSSMFSGCTSLTTAPELPSETLAEHCYDGMFYGCTTLTTAPELPATTLVDGCYNYMFKNCFSLNYIKCLATDRSASRCTNKWFDWITNTGTFVKHPDMNNWPTGSSGIPSGWTIVDAEL